MKTIILVLLSVLIQDFGFGQRSRQITRQDSIMIHNQIESRLLEMKTKMESEQNRTGYPDDLDIEFRLDTSRIEQKLRMKLKIDYSTSGMLRFSEESTESYDLLLNKYYQKLLDKLNTKDREILREAQRDWIRFRDSEIKLNDLISWSYTDGGTINSVLVLSKKNSITKNRVIEIYRYLTRMIY